MVPTDEEEHAVGWFTRITDAWQGRPTNAPDPSTSSPASGNGEREQVMVLKTTENKIDDGVSFGMRVAAAWTWRAIVLAVGLWIILQVVERLQLVIIPAAIALLLTAMMQPASAALRRWGVPPSLAAATVLIGGLAIVIGVLTAVVRAFVTGFKDLSDNVGEGISKIREWLNDGPLNLSNDQINDGLNSLRDAVTEDRDLQGTAVDTATTAGHVLAGFFLVMFTTFFFIKDGNTIWSFLVGMLPKPARAAVDQAGHYSWRTLISYVRATVLVAGVDALGIGMAVWLLGVPLALPLGALVFLTSFIPIIGATLSGAVAVLVALVAKGPVVALIVLAAVIAVQQLEGHVLQPLLMGRAVALHPLAVLLAIGAGAVLAGIVGALVAVPIIAVINTGVRYLLRHKEGERVAPGEAEPPGTRPTDEDKAEHEKLTDTVAGHEHATGTPTPHPPGSAKPPTSPDQPHGSLAEGSEIQPPGTPPTFPKEKPA